MREIVKRDPATGRIMSKDGPHRTRHPLYITYMSMKHRCDYPKYTQWKDYGGRGIKVCEKWNNSFDAFVADMGERPPGTTIERVDNNGNYEPGNCVWHPKKDQQRNRRGNVMLTFRGRTQTLTEWSEELRINRSTLSKRLFAGHWTVESALSTPALTRLGATILSWKVRKGAGKPLAVDATVEKRA